MALQKIEINNVTIFFDKEKTQKNQTEYNQPCGCQDCKNYYKNIESNIELLGFLGEFGIDYLRAEEIMSFDLDDKIDSLICYRAYYSVVGKLDSEFCTNKDMFSASFETKNNADVKNINVGHDISEDYFFIVIDIDLPFILQEKREFPPQSFAKRILNKIRLIFKRNNVSALQMPPFCEIVEMMSDKGLSYSEDLQIIKVIYNEEKTKRYIVLKSVKGYYKYTYEELHVLDEEEWAYVCNLDNVNPAYWASMDRSSACSFFGTEDETISALYQEPEYKMYFQKI